LEAGGGGLDFFHLVRDSGVGRKTVARNRKPQSIPIREKKNCTRHTQRQRGQRRKNGGAGKKRRMCDWEDTEGKRRTYRKSVAAKLGTTKALSNGGGIEKHSKR